jgi:serine-type D-Ala-D-Ala carboxypeptidase/endopeptidase (penicillin-binding protein 4)
MPSTNSSSGQRVALHRSRPLVLTALLFQLALSGCAATTPPTLAPAGRSAIDALQADLRAIFGAPQFHRATWGVVIQSIESGETLFALNPTKLMVPGSNMKILTLAATAERMGWDYTFETRLVTSAPVEGGVLKGDLVVVGSGDPTIGDRSDDADQGRLFDAWADELLAAGVHAIDGRLIGDDRAFDGDGIGDGWSWDDLAYAYAAPVSALTYDSNAVELSVRPGGTPGSAAEIMVRPAADLAVENHVVTSPPGGSPSVELRRSPGTTRVIARGTIPIGAPQFVRTVSVNNPTDFFLRSLQRTLAAHGIAVTGSVLDIDDVVSPPDLSSGRVLMTHHSAPLSEIAAPMMKLSLNLVAETFLNLLGERHPQTGTVHGGRQAVRDVLQSWGISPDSVVLSDGSGLSRYNYVTADALVSVLRHLARDPRHAGPFEATLPVAGRSGTLTNRMTGTRAENNARAKTGFLTNVRALSGFVRTRDDEPLAFAVLTNGSNVPPESIDAATDQAVGHLADFSRLSR